MKNDAKFLCRICGNSRNNQEYTLRENKYGLWEPFKYVQCSSCNCLQLKKVPDDLSKYYPVNYHIRIPEYTSFNEKLKIKLFSEFLKHRYYKTSLIGKFVNFFKSDNYDALDAFMKLSLDNTAKEKKAII